MGENGVAAVVDDRKARLDAIRRRVEEKEAGARAMAEEAEERALLQREEAADLAIRRGTMMRMVDHFKKLAETDGSYIVAPFDMEDHTPGAGLYVLRSPSTSARRSFQMSLAEAGNDPDKADLAYNNLSGECILWTDAPGDPDGWNKHKAKYSFLTTSIGDAAGRLGGAADRARKR